MSKRLTEAFLKKIGDYMLVETGLSRADICIVFGNPHADHLAAHAAALYHQGYFKKLVVTGGVATDDGRLEAHRIRDVLVSKGVPEASILVEDRSTNTGENVKFSMEKIDRYIGLQNVGSVMAIGHIHAARRFLMTLQRHWPGVTKMFTTNNCFGVPKELWHTDPDFRRKVIAEYEKIPAYKAKDFIREIDIEEINRRISYLPKPPKPPRHKPPAP